MPIPDHYIALRSRADVDEFVRIMAPTAMPILSGHWLSLLINTVGSGPVYLKVSFRRNPSQRYVLIPSDSVTAPGGIWSPSRLSPQVPRANSLRHFAALLKKHLST